MGKIRSGRGLLILRMKMITTTNTVRRKEKIAPREKVKKSVVMKSSAAKARSLGYLGFLQK